LALSRVRERRVVVEESVEPDVEDLGLVPRHGYAPAEPGPSEGDVVEAALDERERLVVSGGRSSDEARALGVQTLERLLERRQPEEVVVLDLALQHDLVDRAAVALEQLGVGLEVGAAGAVEALVVAWIDVAGVVDRLQHALDGRHVLRIRGADEEVVRGVDAGSHVAEAL